MELDGTQQPPSSEVWYDEDSLEESLDDFNNLEQYESFDDNDYQ